MRRVCFCSLISFVVAVAGPKLHLKNRVIDPSESGKAVRVKLSHNRAVNAARVHVLVQYDHEPTPADVATLSERGVTVTGYVHENGLMVSCKDPGALDGLGLLWASRLEVSDKLSPLLDDDGGAAVFEFHSDVDINDARRIFVDAGLTIVENPDLGPHHLMAGGSAGQIRDAAERDEVAYVFPPSDSLRNREPVIACAGAITALGTPGQYTAVAGEGWDGPGKGSATLSYFFSNSTSQIPDAQVREEVLRAFNEWTRYVKLMLTPAGDAAANRTINILFGHRDHGDPYPFDGPGGALAHTFYPAPPNPEPIAGDMHFDDDERWRIGADVDLFAVALHEMGHALGLGHSDRPGSVMYPYYSRVRSLTSEDIAAIQRLYAPQDQTGTPPSSPSEPSQPSTPTPDPTNPGPHPVVLRVNPAPATVTSEMTTLAGTASGGTGPIEVRWSSDRGHGGVAAGSTSWTAQVQLENGANSITVMATDTHVSTFKTITITRQVPATPIILEITSPVGGAFSSAIPSFAMRGRASHPSGIRLVTWVNDRGGSGTAQGTDVWDTGDIPLKSGLNNITVRAVASDGTAAARFVPVVYSTRPNDTTAPTVTITNPGSTVVSTTAQSIVLKGIASDNTAVVGVTWFSSTGVSGAATGTTTWQTSPIPLIQGYNSLVVRAFDAAGNMGWRVVSVTRR
jgi:hypothetical protein